MIDPIMQLPFSLTQHPLCMPDVDMLSVKMCCLLTCRLRHTYSYCRSQQAHARTSAPMSGVLRLLP